MAGSDPYQVFISYRRDGGENLSRLIEERLAKIGYKVFLDVEALKEGRFDEALYDYLDQSTDVVVVLPPRGLDRCVSEGDWVRREIAHALEKHKNVVPFLMRNFEFPASLPPDIAPLTRLNGVNENHEYFDKTIEKLVSFLKSTPIHGNLTNEQLRKAAGEGSTQAMNELGLRCELGSEEGVHQSQAMGWYQYAADQGNPAALYNLADVYEQCSADVTRMTDYGIEAGDGVKSLEQLQDRMYEKAVDLYEKARGLGFKPAAFRLGNLAEERRDYQKALAFYREAEPYAPALNALGYYYKNGIAVALNEDEALRCFSRAAESGNAQAIYNYARMLEQSDPERAILTYRRVAFGENAIPEASYCLGKLHESRGEYVQAANCYRVARDSGIAEAEMSLKKCQEYSLG